MSYGYVGSGTQARTMTLPVQHNRNGVTGELQANLQTPKVHTITGV
jgi:hypothetical protein